MSNKILPHADRIENPPNLQQRADNESAKDFDHPTNDLDHDSESEDINAIAETHQRKFPIATLLVICAVIIGLLGGAVYYVKTELGSIGKKPPTPAASPDPIATSKPIQIDDAGSVSADPVEHIPTDPQPQTTETPAPRNTPAPGVPSPKADSACPHVPVKDPLGSPVMQANGMPAMVDCQGRVVRVPEIQPTSTPRPPAKGAAGQPEQPGSATSASRYRGAIVIGTEGTAGNTAPPSGLGQAPHTPTSPADASLAALQQQLLAVTSSGQGSTIKPPDETPAADRNSSAPRNSSRDRAVAVKSIDENLVIPKGHTADCTLTTRAITETNGFAECIITSNVYSANGRTLLIERFSKALGEYNVVTTAGQRVIPILWTSIRKPGGITIELTAPAVDGLGGAGVPASVDNRWGERIGGAYLLSVVKDVIAYKTAKDAGGAAAGPVYQNTTQASNDMIEKILSTTIAIRPTLYANQGDRAMILFNRDVDFSGVYDVQRRTK